LDKRKRNWFFVEDGVPAVIGQSVGFAEKIKYGMKEREGIAHFFSSLCVFHQKRGLHESFEDG
jgi:hypothetical protein